MFYCFCFSHMFILLLSLLYWRFTFRRGRFSCHHPVRSSWNIGGCLMRGPFFASLTFPAMPPFPIFSQHIFFYTFFTSVFTYHQTASPAVLQGHCGLYCSIYHSITLYFAIFSDSSYPVIPFTFQKSIMVKLLLRPSNPNQRLFEVLPLKRPKLAAAISYPRHQWK